jgi:hypothetical protein
MKRPELDAKSIFVKGRLTLSLKRQTITNIGENVEKLEESYIAGGNIKS